MPRKAAKELRIWSHCVDGRRMVHNSRVYGMYDPELQESSLGSDYAWLQTPLFLQTRSVDTKFRNWQNLEITSPHPVAPLRYYLWQLAVLAMSTPLRSTLFEEYTFTPTKVIIIFPFCQTNTLSMGTSVLTTAFIAPALLDLEI